MYHWVLKLNYIKIVNLEEIKEPLKLEVIRAVILLLYLQVMMHPV